MRGENRSPIPGSHPYRSGKDVVRPEKGGTRNGLRPLLRPDRAAGKRGAKFIKKPYYCSSCIERDISYHRVMIMLIDVTH
ncbi:hypothetical protein NDU88_006350 [Pleurodeles waltl]|uniref:Uncharacterized protein n=1 Tax=Pleurodeles waltl TaxID=8319 RepID=A0AAV7N8D9_PLEWA|nr:hypothetical protein NDU88_006350 [Pleurodeles waltl]